MPLMLSVMLASTIGGRVMSRTARYRPTAIVGALLLAVGTGAMTLMTDGSPLFVPSLCAAVVGLGIGLTTPAHMVAVQNSVGEDRLGAATSTTQFTRKIGSTLGVAIAGGLFSAATASQLRSAGALGDDESLSSLLETPSRIDALPDQLEATVRSAVASGCSGGVRAHLHRRRGGVRALVPAPRRTPRRRDRGGRVRPSGVPVRRTPRESGVGAAVDTRRRRRQQRAVVAAGHAVHGHAVETTAHDLPRVGGVVTAQQLVAGAQVQPIGDHG